ncbi:MAG: DEAD/DEAH box helicase [Mariprofundales bacterium]
MSTPIITVPLLRKHLNAAYLRRGKRIYESKAIVHFDLVDSLHLRGAVQDEDNEPFEVSISFSEEGIKGDCSCTVGFNCPHVAALLYNLRDRQQQDGQPKEDKQVEATSEPKPQSSTINPAFDRWLTHLNQNDGFAMADDNIYAPSTKQRLIYLIKSTPKGDYNLHLNATQQLTNGGYGMLNSFALDRIQNNRPNFALANDLALIALMIAARKHPQDNHIPLVHRKGEEILKQAIATGRCHYGDHHQPPLTLSGIRQGSWQWQQGALGEQSLQLLVDHAPLATLALTPPYYIDHNNHCCGPIRCQCSDGKASKLLLMAAIEVEQQKRVFAKLINTLPNDVPRPVAVEIENRLINPTPVLNLYSLAPTPLNSGNNTGGEFFFDYDGHPVFSDTERSVLSWIEDGVLVRCRRDISAELHSRSLLVRFGLSHFPVDPHQRKIRMPEWVISNTDDWFSFVTDAVPQLRAEGFIVNVEAEFRYQAVEVDGWDFSINDGEGIIRSASLTAKLDNDESLDLVAAISNWLHEDPDRLSDEALEALLQQEKIHMPMDDGRWLVMPTQILHTMLQHMMEFFIGNEGISGNQWLAVRNVLEQQENIRFQQDNLWLEQMRMLAEIDTIPAAAVPNGLHATLRDYQLDGLNWLQFLSQSNLGGILADDMGLGKTVQTLTHILLEKEEGRLTQPALVVAPTSLMHNWKAEAARFTPDLSVLVLHGPNRAEHFDKIADYDLVLTTYPLLSRDQTVLNIHHYHLLILDEAQQVKNPRSKAAQMVRIIKANHRLCLTGTPLENHLGELWTQFDFLMPGYLFGQRTFTTLYRRPIEQDGLESRQHQLNLRIRPFMLRRAKSDVVKELPPKTEIVRCVDMEEAQQRLYESVRLTMEKKVRDSVSSIGIGRSQLIVLDALLKMRQVCCDPRLLKLQKTANNIPSAKLDLLCDMLPEMVSEGRRILLFSQFTQMLKLIEEACSRLNISYTKLTGNTRDRVTPIENFQQGKVPLFLISLKAGGTGLNLTAADTVIHYDPWWNPAVEDQATDRAHRIGQSKSVFVYKMITAGTVEERIVEMQARKRQLAEGVHAKAMGKQPLWSGDELESLFKPLTS